MPEVNYQFFITEFVRIFVYLYYDKGIVLNFVVKLEYLYNNRWHEVERYDCFHNNVHKDILNPKGEKIRVISYRHLDIFSGLDVAIKDFKENYEFYIWRFTNEK